eukprot:Opistho-1_new@93815
MMNQLPHWMLPYKKTILALLLRLKTERNMGLIFISHDLAVMSEIADELLVMYKGNIVEQGPAKQLFQNPQHPYTKGLLACRPAPQRQLIKLPVVADFLNEDKAFGIQHLLDENSY